MFLNVISQICLCCLFFLIEWAKFELKYAWSETDKIIEMVKDYQLTGQGLLSLTQQDFTNAGIKKIISMSLVERIAGAKETYRSMDDNNHLIKDKITNDDKYPDCITLETDGPPRCIMPCGHALSAASMFGWIKSEHFVFVLFFFVFVFFFQVANQIKKKTKQ